MLHFSPVLAWTLGPMEMLIIGMVALLIFGKRIPEVARSFGRGINEFKRGLQDPPEDHDADQPREEDSRRIDQQTPTH